MLKRLGEALGNLYWGEDGPGYISSINARAGRYNNVDPKYKLRLHVREFFYGLRHPHLKRQSLRRGRHTG